MDFTGRIIAVLPERKGEGKNGPWMSQEYVMEHDTSNAQYPRRLCFNVWGEQKIRDFNIQEGQFYTVSVDIDCREWQGRWFNDIRAWRVAPAGSQASQPVPPAQPAMPAGMPNVPTFDAQANNSQENESDQLPF